MHRADEVDDCSADILIGLHARRSSESLLRFKRSHPNRKTIVALTGTDLYRDLTPTRSRHPANAIHALDQCDRIILLQPLMAKRLKPSWKKKSSLVMMDVPRGKKLKGFSGSKVLRVCVVGHMRYEKDPLRAAMAVRTFTKDVVEITHVGSALTDSLHRRATLEAQKNPNWNWLGSVTYDKVQQLMKSSDLLVNSSRIEGAPNVLFESIRWRLPMIASKIDGHVGVLGSEYEGYFKVGDTENLRRVLLRCNREPEFVHRLADSIHRIAKKYKPGNELKSLLSALSSV